MNTIEEFQQKLQSLKTGKWCRINHHDVFSLLSESGIEITSQMSFGEEWDVETEHYIFHGNYHRSYFTATKR